MTHHVFHKIQLPHKKKFLATTLPTIQKWCWICLLVALVLWRRFYRSESCQHSGPQICGNCSGVPHHVLGLSVRLNCFPPEGLWFCLATRLRRVLESAPWLEKVSPQYSTHSDRIEQACFCNNNDNKRKQVALWARVHSSLTAQDGQTDLAGEGKINR